MSAMCSAPIWPWTARRSVSGVKPEIPHSTKVPRRWRWTDCDSARIHSSANRDTYGSHHTTAPPEPLPSTQQYSSSQGERRYDSEFLTVEELTRPEIVRLLGLDLRVPMTQRDLRRRCDDLRHPGVTTNRPITAASSAGQRVATDRRELRTQNSFPSGSASTTHDGSPCPTSTLVAPRASSRLTSASRSPGRKSR
jgi:hypothetical protein